MKKTLRRKNSAVALLSVALACICLLAACKKDTPPPAAPAPVAKPAPKPVQKAVSSSVRAASPPANQFDFSNKKDPFKPFVAAKPVSPSSSKKVQPDALPILSYDVIQFKLIGIITDGRQNQAMVTDPNGKGYVLRVGMAIGNRGGKVTSISAAGVDVLEKYTDDNGKISSQVTPLTLPRKL